MAPDPMNANSVTWERTNPKLDKDLFYWDASNFAIRTDIAAILGRQHPRLRIREVGPEHANRREETAQTLQWVNRLAKNTIFATPRNSYAMVFASGSTLGSEKLADSNGFTLSGKPIIYDIAKIGDQVTRMGFNGSFLFAFAFAHEAGHQLGLQHPEREGCGKGSSCTYVALPDPLSLLGLTQFSINPSSSYEMYVKIRYYMDPNMNANSPDARPWASDSAYLKIGKLGYSGTVTSAFVQDPTGNLQHIDRITFVSPIFVSPPSDIHVFEQIGSIMDWAPSLLNANSTSVNFTQEQLTAICMHGACIE